MKHNNYKSTNQNNKRKTNNPYLTGFPPGCPDAGPSGNRSGMLFEVLTAPNAPCICSKFDRFKRNCISTSDVIPLLKRSSPTQVSFSDTYKTSFPLNPGKISTSYTLGVSIPSAWAVRVSSTLEQDDKINCPASVSSFKTSRREILPNSAPPWAILMPNDSSQSMLLTDSGHRTPNLKIYNTVTQSLQLRTEMFISIIKTMPFYNNNNNNNNGRYALQPVLVPLVKNWRIFCWSHVLLLAWPWWRQLVHSV